MVFFSCNYLVMQKNENMQFVLSQYGHYYYHYYIIKWAIQVQNELLNGLVMIVIYTVNVFYEIIQSCQRDMTFMQCLFSKYIDIIITIIIIIIKVICKYKMNVSITYINICSHVHCTTFFYSAIAIIYLFMKWKNHLSRISYVNIVQVTDLLRYKC